MMTSTCAATPPVSSSAPAAITAIVIRVRSGVSVRPMPHSANATTATAAIFSPSSHPPPSPPNSCTPYANAASATADGNVNPSHARNPPRYPARPVPTAMPSWLLAGPGKNWHSATSSANRSSDSHPRRTTYSSRKYPTCATGPPNDVNPNRRATSNTSTNRATPITAPLSPTEQALSRQVPPVRPEGNRRATDRADWIDGGVMEDCQRRIDAAPRAVLPLRGWRLGLQKKRAGSRMGSRRPKDTLLGGVSTS